jgi:hypothetical protein
MNASVKAKTPATVKIIAALCLLFGVQALIVAVLNLTNDQTSSFGLNFNILGLPAGIGLLRLRETWRVLVLVSNWIIFIALPVALIAGFVNHSAEMGVLLVGIVFYAVNFIIYRGLTRADIKQLFEAAAVAHPATF